MAAHGKADTERDARRAELQQNDLRREATRKNLETRTTELVEVMTYLEERRIEF